MAALTGEAQGREVNLPHDCMLEKDVEPHSPAGHAMGYYGGIIGCYTKYLEIPKRWSCDKLYLYFDGVMAETSVEINGSPAATHCYGYTPFQADITPFVHFGESNRITVTCSVGMEPDSRWYTGAGIYRHVDLIRTPRLHIKADGIFAHTEYIDYKDGIPASARLQVEITVVNDTPDDRIAAAEASLFPAEPDDPGDTAILTGSASVLVKAGKAARVRIPMTVKHPRLWDAEHPFLYRVGASVKDRGIFRTCLSPSAGQPMEDHCFILFGIRTVTSDSIHGLRINGKIAQRERLQCGAPRPQPAVSRAA